MNHTADERLVREPAVSTGPVVTGRRPFFPAIYWGAIFAGVVVGLALQLVFALLGLALGLSAVDVGQADAGVPGSAPAIAGAWHGVTMLIAAFVGGYVAARMSGLHRKTDGMLHGFVAWGLTTLLFATFASSALSALFGGVFDGLQRGVQGAMSAPATGVAGSRIEDLLKGAGGQVDRQALSAFQQHIQAGRRQEAIDLLASRTGIDPQRAAALVDQALIVTGSPERASPQARESADQAVGTASAATWMIFGAVALSLVLGVWGGAMGATRRRAQHARHA